MGWVISVDPDAKGNIWVFHRSDPRLQVRSIGKLGQLRRRHVRASARMTTDRDGNIWVTDAQNKDGKGQQVFKLSPEGRCS
jgi:sugar lactone lactonase YvrE